MTYLEMVNAVLVRLREDTVTSITDGVEGPLISALVLDAYKIVEDAHNWSVLRSVETANTINLIDTVELTGVPVDSKIHFAYIDGDREVYRVSKEWLVQRNFNNNSETGKPTHYSVTSASATDQDLVVTFHPTPDAVYTVSFDVAKRGTAPTLGSDVLLVPTDPVLHLSLALATRERGETGGMSTPEYFRLFELSLGRAIEYDANLRPDELIMYRV